MEKSEILKGYKNADDFRPFVSALLEGADVRIKGVRVAIQTAKRFDGKVYNARFINALNTDLEAVGVKDYGDGRAFPLVQARKGDTDNVEFTNHVRDFHHPRKGTIYFYGYLAGVVRAREFVTDDGRIDAAKFEKGAGRLVDSLCNLCTLYADALAYFDEYVEQLQELDAIVARTLRGINPLFHASGFYGFTDSDFKAREDAQELILSMYR